MSEWKPIETAPRTGEMIILCAVPRKRIGGVDGNIIYSDIVTIGQFKRDDNNREHGGIFEVPLNIWGNIWTHWMSLPPSPYVEPTLVREAV